MIEPHFPKFSEPALRWVRFIGLLAALALLSWIAYRLRAVCTPLLVAAGIAYVLNPVVAWFEKACRIPRLTTAVVTFGLLGILIVTAGFYLASKTAAQVAEFEQRVPTYVQTAGRWVELVRAGMLDAQRTPSPSPLAGAEDQRPAYQPGPAWTSDWWLWAGPVLEKHGVTLARSALNYLGTAFASAANLLSLLVLIPVFTFYFLWRFDDCVHAAHDHLPAAHRDGIVRVVRIIDRAMAGFFRGRLIVCLLVGTLSGLGWSLVGVPYSVPLGVLTGILNLVPFLSLLALPPALLFAYLGATEAETPWLWPVLLAMGVYMAVQALDSFVLGPVIVGRASGLHPLVAVAALLIGAELGGVLGMLLAIPVASTLKTLAAELVLPELRRLAAARPASHKDQA